MVLRIEKNEKMKWNGISRMRRANEGASQVSTSCFLNLKKKS